MKNIAVLNRFTLKNSILRKFVLLLLLFTMVPLLILGVISYLVSSDILKNELNGSMIKAQDKLTANIDLNLNVLIGAVVSLSNDQKIKSYIQDPSDPSPENRENEKGIYINTQLKDLIISLKFPVQAFIIDYQGMVYGNKDYLTPQQSVSIASRITGSEWYKKLFRYDDSVFWIGRLKTYDDQSGGEYLLYFGKNILDGDDYLGTVIFGLQEYFISKQINQLKISDESTVLVVDEAGNLIVKSEDSNPESPFGDIGFLTEVMKNNSGSYSTHIREKKHMVNFQTLAYFGWKVVAITPEDSIYRKMYFIRNTTFVLMILSFVLILASILIIRRSIVSPIIHLSRLMKKVRQGNLEVASQIVRSDEIGILSDGFNSMVREIRSLIEAIKADEQTKRELEFKVLQAQIKPHFLYNTLNSIKWMAEIKHEKNIVRAVTTLVKMMEYTMNERNTPVTLKQELEYIRSYLHLSNIRYGNNIDSEVEIEEELQEAGMPKLILQPIVENSVTHGLIRIQGRGRIRVSAIKTGPDLLITVEDNGIGMEEQTAARLPDPKYIRPKSDKPGGMGLRNVNERLKIEYGDQYGLRLHSSPGNGTRVQILLPFRKLEEDQAESCERTGCKQDENTDCR